MFVCNCKYCGYCGLYCRMVCIKRNFSEPQNLVFIIESSFKSRAGYNGTRTVDSLGTLGIFMHNKTFDVINSRNLIVIFKKRVKYYTVPNKEG